MVIKAMDFKITMFRDASPCSFATRYPRKKPKVVAFQKANFKLTYEDDKIGLIEIP
jgi:hypothetical protein